MNNSGNLPVSDSAARPVSNGNGKGGGRPRKRATAAPAEPAQERQPAAVGTLTRTKSLLAAALKVWELKQRGYGNY